MRFWVGVWLVNLGMAIAELGDRIIPKQDPDIAPEGWQWVDTAPDYLDEPTKYHYDDYDEALGVYRKGDC